MISQVLPYLLDIKVMVRVNELGGYRESSIHELKVRRGDPLDAIRPESIELCLKSNICHEHALSLLGFACIKHKALLEIDCSCVCGGTYSAIISIVRGSETFQGIFVVRRQSIVLILSLSPDPE